MAEHRTDLVEEKEHRHQRAIGEAQPSTHREGRTVEIVFEPADGFQQFGHLTIDQRLIAALRIDVAEEFAHRFHDVEIADAREKPHARPLDRALRPQRRPGANVLQIFADRFGFRHHHIAMHQQRHLVYRRQRIEKAGRCRVSSGKRSWAAIRCCFVVVRHKETAGPARDRPYLIPLVRKREAGE